MPSCSLPVLLSVSVCGCFSVYSLPQPWPVSISSISTRGLYPLGPVLPSGSLSGTDQILAIGHTGNFYVLDLSYKDVVIASPDGTIIASYEYPVQI